MIIIAQSTEQRVILLCVRDDYYYYAAASHGHRSKRPERSRVESRTSSRLVVLAADTIMLFVPAKIHRHRHQFIFHIH
jgi:hypothetical protein